MFARPLQALVRAGKPSVPATWVYKGSCKMRFPFMSINLLVLTVGMSLTSATAYAQKTWHVDDDACPGSRSGTEDDPFCSIQTAINAASEGDVIIVLPNTSNEDGHYFEHIKFLGKAITVHSLDPDDLDIVAATVVNGWEEDLSAVSLVSGESDHVVCILLITTSARAQTVWYVDDDGEPGNGCTAWDDACPELQTALSLAEASDQIWVAIGTYEPDYDVNSDQHTGDRTATFQLISGVAIYGGFDGTEMGLEQRAGLFEETTLSGDLLENDGPDFANNDENCYHVVTGSGVDETATLDGFSIAGGNADGECCSDNSGGGISNHNGSPTIMNCMVVNNSASGIGSKGGGMHNRNANPIIDHCSFEGNAADVGGAVCNDENSSPSITNCMFENNVARGGQSNPFVGRGGGIYNRLNSNSTITQCVFKGNVADSFGGGICNANSDPIITQCTFEDNTASSGGGIYNGNASDPDIFACLFHDNSAFRGGGMSNEFNSNPMVMSCLFHHNFASSGGGLFNRFNVSPTVINCIFSENSTTGSGGGMDNVGANTVTVSNCIFRGNSAAQGGGFRTYGTGNVVLMNSLLTGNFASSRGGGWRNSSAIDIPVLHNCVIAGNVAGDDGGAISSSTANSKLVNCIVWDNIPNQFGGEGTFNVEYSNISGGFPGEGNIDADPLFVDSDFWDDNETPGIPEDDFWVEGDYHLLPGSPCIDAADNTAVPLGVDTDLDGNPRFADDPDTPDTGNPDGINPIVDMGAYEFNCVDDDGDGMVTICHIPPGNPANAHTITVSQNALPAHLAHGDSCGPCEEDDGAPPGDGDDGETEASACPADLDGDGAVNASDLAELLTAWGVCPAGANCPADIDADGGVGATDLSILLNNWNSCP